MMKYGIVILLFVVVLAVGVWRSRSLPVIETSTTDSISTVQSLTLPEAREMPHAVATSEEQRKLKVLEEILKSKNDNDPRLDREFQNLSEKTKELFREKYAALPQEKRNEKGTIVFLLGKNLKEAADFRFLESVLTESPCYNLANCKDSGGGKGDPAHEDMGSAITLAYPQVVSLKAVEKYLSNKNSGSTHSAEALRVLETGKTSQVQTVSRTADKLYKNFRE